MDTTTWGLPVRRLERSPGASLDPTAWPATVPAVAQVLRDGWDLGPATVLVGENGAGKSTLVEALAGAFGLDVRGGTANTRGLLADAGDPLEGAALPGARLLVVDEEGLTETAWEDLALVSHWRSFLQDPQRYVRHVVG